MPESKPTASSYIVLTTQSAGGRPDTRVDGVIAMAWDDDMLRLDGADGPLFVAPLRSVVYVKNLGREISAQAIANSGISSATVTSPQTIYNAPQIVKALVDYKRTTGSPLGLS